MKKIISYLFAFIIRLTQPDVEKKRGNIIAYLLDENKEVISVPADAFLYMVNEREIVVKSECLVVQASVYKHARLSICYNGKTSFRQYTFPFPRAVSVGDVIDIKLHTHFDILEHNKLEHQ